MSRFALINSDNTVFNIIVCDNEADYTPEDGVLMVACSDHVHIGAAYADGDFLNQQDTVPVDSIAAKAQAELDVVTGPRGTVIRCVAAAIAVPSIWISYIVALRAIASGKDTVSTSLPTRPEYPSGT